MADWLTKAIHGSETVSVELLTVRLLASFGFGCMVAGVYHVTTRVKNRAFLATLVLLSVLIALVTMVIGTNENAVARAFTLVGALAIVRFRTVVEDTRDTAFVIFAVVVGMAAGAGQMLAAAIGIPLVLLAAWLFRPRSSEPEPREATLILRLAVARPPDERITEMLRKHIGAHRLTGMATARGGAALDVTYSIRSAGPEVMIALVTELNRLEGMQGAEFREL